MNFPSLARSEPQTLQPPSPVPLGEYLKLLSCMLQHADPAQIEAQKHREERVLHRFAFPEMLRISGDSRP